MGLRRRGWGELAEAGADNINTVTLRFDEAPRNETYSVVIDRETVQPGAGGWELSLDMYGWQDILRVEDHMVYHDVEVERLPLERSAVPLEWTITDPGALAMRMQFREFDLDGCGAKLELYSAVTDTWTHVTGDDVAANDGWSAWIEGDTIDVRVQSPNDCGGFWVPYAQSRAWTMTDRFRARTSGETSVTRDGPFGIQAQGGAIVDTEFDRHWFRTITYGAPAGQKQSAIGRRQGTTPPHLCGSPDEIIDYYTEEVCVENRFEFVVPYGEDDCHYSVFEGLDGFEFTGDGGVVRRVDFRGTCDAPVRHGRVTGAQDPTDGFGPVPVPDTDPCAREEEVVLGPLCRDAAQGAYIGDVAADTDCDGLSDFVERCVLGTCWDPDMPCEQEYTAGAHDTDGDGWWDGWEVCGLTELQPGDGRAIAAHVFAGPSVRDLLLEVLVANDTNAQTATPDLALVQVDSAFRRLNRATLEPPAQPAESWEPLGFGVTTRIYFDGSGINNIRDAASAYSDFGAPSGGLILPVVWGPLRYSNRSRNVSFEQHGLTLNAVYIIPFSFDQRTLLHEFGHHLGLNHDVTSEGRLTSRSYNPIYHSVMTSAFSWRLEADPTPAFSEGGRRTVIEREVQEDDFSGQDYSRAQYLSAFWRDQQQPHNVPPLSATGQPQANATCFDPGNSCPTGYSCFAQDGVGIPRYNGPNAEQPQRGGCYASVPHVDWNGNGVVDLAVLSSLNLSDNPGDPETLGWDVDADCDVNAFALGQGDNPARVWEFLRAEGPCEAMPATGASGQLIVRLDFCLNSGPRERVGEYVPPGDTVASHHGLLIPVVDGTGNIEEQCHWVSAYADLWDGSDYGDQNDFSRLGFVESAAPLCGGGDLKFVQPEIAATTHGTVCEGYHDGAQ